MLAIYNLFIFFSLNIFLVNTFYIREKKNISLIEFYTIFIWHFLFSLVYFVYVAKYGGDTNGYIEYAKDYLEIEKKRSFQIGSGSNFIYIMVYFFFNDLKLDLLNIISIFNFIGFIGLIYLFKTLKNISKKISTNNVLFKNLIYLIIFIPSLSFWTSGIGKEPFVFLSISLFLYSLNRKRLNYFILFFAFVILFLVRWQFSIIMLFSTLLIFKFHEIPKLLKNLKVVSFLFIVFLIMNVLTSYFFNFHIFKLDPILNAIYDKQNHFIGTNLTNFDTNFLFIILNYLFSPINFKNIFFTIASLENFYVIIIIFLLLINFERNNLKNINLAVLSFIILFLLTIPFATFNIGIAIRQKWIVLVAIFVLLASGLKRHEKE